MKKPKAAVALEKRPSLYMMETRLQQAWASLTARDPEAEWSVQETEAYLAQFLDRKAAVANRDEFAQFIRNAEAFAAAKAEIASQYASEADEIRRAIARMRETAIAIMHKVGVTELVGNVDTIEIKRSRGRVVIENELALPREFWRVPEDETLGQLRELLDRMDGQWGIEDLADELRAIVEGHEARTRVPDKTAINDAFKAAGVKSGEVPPPGTVPGATREVEETLVIR